MNSQRVSQVDYKQKVQIQSFDNKPKLQLHLDNIAKFKISIYNMFNQPLQLSVSHDIIKHSTASAVSDHCHNSESLCECNFETE